LTDAGKQIRHSSKIYNSAGHSTKKQVKLEIIIEHTSHQLIIL